VAEPAKRKATYADLEAVPLHLVAEIIHGALVTHPRPNPRHAVAAFALSEHLGPGYRSGRGGPGGWVFMPEPQLHLGEHVVVPDLAGWRRERMPLLPDTASVVLPPDWICEIFSPSTEEHDRTVKRAIYGAAGVPYLWHVDPRLRVLEVFQLTAGHWLLAKAISGDGDVCAVPFEAVSFPLQELWPFDPPVEN
jgi:Uma2 family endonuclease